MRCPRESIDTAHCGGRLVPGGFGLCICSGVEAGFVVARKPDCSRPKVLMLLADSPT